MNRIDNYQHLETEIVSWLDNYANLYDIKSFVIGVSGGIDSAVTSTLAAKTGKKTYVLNMPIHQNLEQESLSAAHISWLENNYDNVVGLKFDLTKTFDTFKQTMNGHGEDKLSLANSRSRLRMVTLYQVAGSEKGLVVGTGNKVEDYGVGFYTKYGDGGVDIAPIADLYKTEVWELGKHLGIDSRIIEAKPTDGLWDDGRTDEDQIGATYEDLEQAMEYGNGPAVKILHHFNVINKHKMQPIPTFKL